MAQSEDKKDWGGGPLAPPLCFSRRRTLRLHKSTTPGLTPSNEPTRDFLPLLPLFHAHYAKRTHSKLPLIRRRSPRVTGNVTSRERSGGNWELKSRLREASRPPERRRVLKRFGTSVLLN